MDELLVHFAAVRAPRGQEPCSCCDADGVHPGQTCSRCDGTGFVKQGSDDPFCPGRAGDEPAPARRRHWREPKTAAGEHEIGFQEDYHGRHRVWAAGEGGLEASASGYGGSAGELHWHPERGTITYLNVPEGHQRQGIATALYRRAQAEAAARGLAAPVHSSSLSPGGGEAWARSTGDPLPPKEGSADFHAVTAWGERKPHAAAIHEAQEDTRLDHPAMTVQLPEPRWTGFSDDADHSLRHMLRRAGYPEHLAAGAWVHRKPETATASSTAWDPGDGTVGVGLHPHRWDYGTMAHEAAHLITNHAKGIPPDVMGQSLGLTDADVHDQHFADTYEHVIRTSWGDEAGDNFRRHHGDAKTLVSNYRARVHKLPRIDGPMQREAMGDPGEYGIRHRPMEIGAPMHDLTGEGPDADPASISYHPDDYLTHPQYNSDTSPPSRGDYQALAQMRRVRGKPDHLVDIYRATHHSAPHEMNPGDWVTLSKDYARQHAEASSAYDEHDREIPDTRYVVHHARVRARDVRDAGSGGYREQGYWGPSIGCCGHEKTAVLPMSRPEYGPEPKYDFAPEDWPPEKRDAHNQTMFDKRTQWKASIKRGLSLGHLTAPEAKAHGYYFGGHETDDRNDPKWAKLPHDLYHVTTDEPSVRQHGLKTRAELSQQTGGHGLGGGEDDTISFTTDHRMARGILGALHEFHGVVNGTFTPKQMWDQARAGHGADRPFHQDIARYYKSDWKDGDELPRALHNTIHEVQRDNTMGSSQEMIDKVRGPGWHPAHDDEGWMSGHKPPQKMHAWWEKEMDPDQRRENAASFYKHFAVHRQYAGGAEDPMFFATDTKAFAAKDPKHFALLHVRPKPGAQGYPVSSMSEWRTGTGDAVEVHHAEHAEPQQHHEGSGVNFEPYSHLKFRTSAWEKTSGPVPAAERTESVRHMLDHYNPYDFDTWDEVRHNINWDHPSMQSFVADVARNGVKRPVPVDYEQDPPQVRNGHTRLLAAERAGIEYVGTRQHEGFMDPDDPDHLGRGPDDPGHWTNRPEWNEHEGAASPAYPNPHTNGREWYHGTKASGEQLAGGLTPTRYDPEKEREFTVAHWNSLLGIHFAAHHAMADRFAGRSAGGLSRPSAWEANTTPSVVHARLDIRNPKAYRSEHDMDDEAYEHEYDQRKNHIDKHLDAAGDDAYDRFSSNTRGFEGDSRYRIPSDDYEEYDDFEGDDEDRPAPVPRRTLWLNAHPDKEGIANRFRQRLQAQGHDGIIYHNDFEHERVRSRGEHANKVAIAFDPAQVRVTKHHLLGQEGHTAALGKTADDDAGEHDDDGGQWDTCYHCQEEHDPQEHAGDPGFMPDWNRVVNNTPSIHRALGVVLPDREHAIVHDPKTRAGTAARIIAHHLATAYPEHGHTHWSAPEGLNEVRDSFGGYAAHHVSPEGEHGLHGPRVTEVVMHAQTPDRGDIEDNPHELISRQISPYRHPEYEIPLARGAPVHLTGMSWRKSHSPGWTEDHRYIPAQQDKWRNHSFAKPFRIEAVLPVPGMRNPHTGGDEWFHGTRAYPEELSEHGFSDPMEFSTEAFEQPDAEPQGHWNALLGTHFTADHDIAKEFALGEHSSGANSRGADPFRGEARHILHARLGLHNPKVYASEHDMDHEAYEHEHAAGNHPVNHVPQLGSDDPEDRYEAEEMWPGTHMLHQQYGARKIPAKAQLAGHPVRTNWLNSHPDRWGIADRYRKRLQDQGHDGIVYGNEYEHSKHGKNADKSAIVFDPARIQVTQRHHAYADHLSPEEGEHQQARMPGAGQQQLFSPRLGARDISKIRLKHEPPIVSGHWERDEQGAPSNWVDTDPAQGHHMLTALAPNNRTVGWMHWDKGVVRKIDVNDNWKRSGLGRRMWEHASTITPGLSHSDNRTDEGQGFAKAVGGPLPERVQDHPEWFRDAARRKPLQPGQEECWKCGVRDSKEMFTKSGPYAPVMGLAMECTDKDACRRRREEGRRTAANYRGKFRCRDCGWDTNSAKPGVRTENYVVHDDVWHQAGMDKMGGNLCVGCLEKRLGRQLHSGDFPEVPVNDLSDADTDHAYTWRTDRLKDRIQRTAGQRGDLPELEYYHVLQGREKGGYHAVAAAHDGQIIGHLTWGPGRTKINRLWVHPQYRRHGVADALYQRSKWVEPGLQHHTDRTEAGDAWARSVSADVPEHLDDTTSGDADRKGAWAASQFQQRLDSGHRTMKLLAAVFVPTERIFGPTYGLDHRLFDEHEQLRPGVRQALLGRLQGVLEPVLGQNWDAVTRVYLAGSEASRWTSPELVGNGDLDVLIGVAYSYARLEAPHLAGLTDVGIDKHLNALLQEHFNAPGWHPPFGPEDTYDLTGYVNHDALDIRAIKPYAAYDLTSGEWAVKPPDLPDWSAEQFPQGPALMQQARALIAEVRAILRLPEPFRTQEAGRIWDYIHEGRRLDFTETGLGWQGTGNVLEKALDQASGGLVEKLKQLKYGPADHAPAALGHGMTTADLGSAHA